MAGAGTEIMDKGGQEPKNFWLHNIGNLRPNFTTRLTWLKVLLVFRLVLNHLVFKENCSSIKFISFLQNLKHNPDPDPNRANILDPDPNSMCFNWIHNTALESS